MAMKKTKKKAQVSGAACGHGVPEAVAPMGMCYIKKCKL